MSREETEYRREDVVEFIAWVPPAGGGHGPNDDRCWGLKSDVTRPVPLSLLIGGLIHVPRRRTRSAGGTQSDKLNNILPPVLRPSLIHHPPAFTS
jgi:hypothetical protein